MLEKEGGLTRQIFLSSITGVLISLILGPFYWMVVTAIRNVNEVTTLPVKFFPRLFSLAGFRDLFGVGGLVWMKNSFILASFTLLFSLLIVIPAAYAVSRFNFPGSRVYLIILLAIRLFPGALTVIPLYKALHTLGLLDNYPALIFTYLGLSIPIPILILQTFFHSIPRELDEQAMIDGCSRLQVIWRIIIPVSLPGIIAIGTYIFIVAWNEFMYPLIFLQSDKLKPLQVGIAGLTAYYGPEIYIDRMAGATFSVVPVIILFLCFNKYLQKGLTSGALKE